MFKRKKLSTSDISTISTTSENVAITNPVTSDVTSSMPAVVSPVLSEIKNVENSITPADVSKLPVAKSPTVTWSLESAKQSSDDALPTAIDELFQPRDPKFNFPLRSFSNGKKEKRFNRNWLENKDWKSWLHYNPEKDAAFCATCVNATRMNLISNKNADKAFILNGFAYWPDAGTKNRGFDKHFKSESHKEAHARLNTIPEACGDIADQMSTAINNERSANRQNLLKILLNVKFLARQALPLRGHGSGEDSNFTQLYILREEDNEGLKTWRTEKKINKYVHSPIHNEMMQIMALKILREIATNLQDSDFFTMMCDEATDVKNVSQVVVCLHWIDENINAHNEFIGLKDMPSTDADLIVRELKDALLRMRLKLEKCRGQCYDGCSTMSGAKSSVAVQISCVAHTDNLNQTLQGTQMTAIDAQVISRACVTTLQSLRSEDEFNLFWAKVKQFATAHNVDAPSLPRRRNAPINHMLGKAPGEHPEKVEGDC